MLKLFTMKVNPFISLVLGVFVLLSVPTFASRGIEKVSKLPIFDAHFDLQKIERLPANVNIKAVLVICDHYVTPENNAIAQSLRVDLGTVNQLLDILEKRKIATVEKIVLQGTKATMANILSTMNSLQAGTNDVILYYFSGHGLMEKGKTYMLTADEKNLGRAQVESIMNSKNARFKMLITDACSNDVDGMTASRSISKGNQQIDAGLFDETYKDLFWGYKGMMHLSASTEGELAWSNDNFGGFFTYHFFKEGLIKKPVNDWTQIFAGAKDKTSQMFMRMPAEQRSQLAKQGVNNQTAKAFAMPISQKNTTNNSTTNIQPNKPAPPKVQTLAPGKINLFNYSGSNIQFFADYNKPSQLWVESNVKTMTLNASKFTTIPYAETTIGYNINGRDYYFELENGDYFFAYDETGSLELFYKEEGINESNFNSIAITDYNDLLLGNWEWEDGTTGQTMLTSFEPDIFVDTNLGDDSQESGSWSVRKQEIDGEEYNFVTFVYEDENESMLLDYCIMYDQEYPDQLQLIFISAFENGEEIPYEEAEEFLEPSLMLYRVIE